MKTTLLITSLISLIAVAQMRAQGMTSLRPTDTILANEHKSVALFFPDPIRQGITGSPHFVFTYNREKEQHLGLLQATPGEVSNLLVISDKGEVFSYILMYSDKLEKLNYFVFNSGSIGNENFQITEGKIGEEEDLSSVIPLAKYSLDKEVQFRNFCSFLLRKKAEFGNIHKRKSGISLHVENIIFHGEELYFVLKIQNKSSLDYEPDFLNISVETSKKGKKKSIQRILQEPVYTFRVPGKIQKEKIARFVYVLPKFSIAEDKVVILDLNERNGERDIELKVSKKYINNPN